MNFFPHGATLQRPAVSARCVSYSQAKVLAMKPKASREMRPIHNLRIAMLPLACALLGTTLSAVADIHAPVDGHKFGMHVLLLPNGNIAVCDELTPGPNFETGPGAVHLFTSGGTRISTLRGSRLGDAVCSGGLAQVPGTNRFFVLSPKWANGAAANAGAVTWIDGDVGLDAEVSASNSIVGSTAGDSVGGQPLFFLDNGKAVVSAPQWDNGAAVDAGAVRLLPGNAPIAGELSAANALVGSRTNDRVGASEVFAFVLLRPGIRPLPGGDFIVHSPFWDNGDMLNVGAVTRVDGTTGLTGPVDATNSLVGGSSEELLGRGLDSLTLLADGSQLLRSPRWDGPAGADQGAVLRLPADHALVGPVGLANAMTGGQAQDRVGSGAVLALPNGAALVASPEWRNGAAAQAGAVTWIGPGVSIAGTQVGPGNSLVGTQSSDRVGEGGFVLLANGNAVAVSSRWGNGAQALAGAVTWIPGASGVSGALSASNSLVGGAEGSRVGDGGAGPNSALGIHPLASGDYFVRSIHWNDGASIGLGAVTWGDGATGASGVVGPVNSLVGRQADDAIGSGGLAELANGSVIVSSPAWRDDAGLSVGAATWLPGQQPTVGAVTEQNSLFSSSEFDGAHQIAPFDEGGALVISFNWEDSRGAITWVSGESGRVGRMGPAISQVGQHPGDRLGSGGVTRLADGSLLVRSQHRVSESGGLGAVHRVTADAPQAGVLRDDQAMVGAPNGGPFAGGWIQPTLGSDFLAHSPDLSAGAGLPNGGGLTHTFGQTAAGQTPGPHNTLFGPAFGDLGQVDRLPSPTGTYLLQARGWSIAGLGRVGRLIWFDPGRPINGDEVPQPGLVGEVVDEFHQDVRAVQFDAVNQRLLVGRPLVNRVSILPLRTTDIFADGFE